MRLLFDGGFYQWRRQNIFREGGGEAGGGQNLRGVTVELRIPEILHRVGYKVLTNKNVLSVRIAFFRFLRIPSYEHDILTYSL